MVKQHWEAYVFYLCDIIEEECGKATQRYGSQVHPDCSDCSVHIHEHSKGGE